MCGRYSWSQKKSFPKSKNFIIPPDISSKASFNRAPGQKHPIILHRDKKIIYESALWGMNLNTKSNASKIKPINARIETIIEKVAFQDAIMKRRCLVPADGYFEWQKNENKKEPYYHYKADNSPFFMAGIWNLINNSVSFCILTHSATSEILHIHHRMPVILKTKDWQTWLDTNYDLNILLSSYQKPSIQIKCHAVSSRVNRVTEDDEKLIHKTAEIQSTFW